MSEALASNLTKAQQYLDRFSASPLLHFVDGKPWAGDSGELFDNKTPVDDSLLGKVAAGQAADVDVAARAAERAFADWKLLPGRERRNLLHTIADAIESKSEEIALVESMDTGQPILRRQGARSAQRSVLACISARQLHDAPAARPDNGDYPVEHAVHARNVENRASACGGLHRASQAARVEPSVFGAARRDLLRSGIAGRRPQYRTRLRRDRG
jgi:acyl-CoA reductase-like NAD-dependent aldehyde dehydrogenase